MQGYSLTSSLKLAIKCPRLDGATQFLKHKSALSGLHDMCVDIWLAYFRPEPTLREDDQVTESTEELSYISVCTTAFW